MGSPVARKRRKRRKFTDEYRAEVVRLVETSDKSIPQIAQELDLTESAVRNWVKVAEKTEAKVVVTEQRDLEDENRTLRKRIKELEMEREILKKAAAFFAKETREVRVHPRGEGQFPSHDAVQGARDIDQWLLRMGGPAAVATIEGRRAPPGRDRGSPSREPRDLREPSRPRRAQAARFGVWSQPYRAIDGRPGTRWSL